MKTGSSTSSLATATLVAAATLWAVSQVAWRFGDGSAVVLAAQRALVGALILVPVLWISVRNGKARSLLRSRPAVVAILCGGLSMPFTATLFRELTGPQAALITALTPAAILLVALGVQHRVDRYVALLVVGAAICGALVAFEGGLGAFSSAGLLAAAALFAIGVVAIFATERARTEFNSSMLVAWSMLVAAVGCYTISGVTAATETLDINASGLVAATVVGVTGTVARVLHGRVVPFVGPTVASSSTYLTAFLTAVGGLIVFGDRIEWAAGLLGFAAAGLACAAMVRGARLRKPSADQLSPTALRNAAERST